MTDQTPPRTPLDLLGALGAQTTELAPGVRLAEVYTERGLLQQLWYGPATATELVLLLPGAMGGFAGPAGLHPTLGRWCAATGRAAVALHYRKPGDLDRCLVDAAATVDQGLRDGVRRVLVVGHSFGGAVAVQVATALVGLCAGVVTLATQSAGCEGAAGLGGTPLLLLHGDRDTILDAENSAMVRFMAGYGDLRIVPGAGHGFNEVADQVRDLLAAWIDDAFTRAAS